MPLFVFGSLRDLEILEVVLGRPVGKVRTAAAQLSGYRTVRLPDESYPVLISAGGSAAEGILLFGLSDEDLSRIAFFENQEYRFAHCAVTLNDGSQQEALYCSDNEIETGAIEPWSLETWQRLHKPVFIEHVRQFMKRYGAASPEEADEIWRELTKHAG